MQTFQKSEEGEGEDEGDLSAGEKSPIKDGIYETILLRRRSTRGSSFAASAGEKEDKEKAKDDEDKTEEVSFKDEDKLDYVMVKKKT